MEKRIEVTRADGTVDRFEDCTNVLTGGILMIRADDDSVIATYAAGFWANLKSAKYSSKLYDDMVSIDDKNYGPPHEGQMFTRGRPDGYETGDICGDLILSQYMTPSAHYWVWETQAKAAAYLRQANKEYCEQKWPADGYDP